MTDVSANRSVHHFLEMLKQEFPNYMNDNDEMIAAVVALSHVVGAVGAIVLLKGGEGRLDKMLKMVTKNVSNTAHEGARAVALKQNVNTEVGKEGPLSNDEILANIARKRRLS